MTKIKGLRSQKDARLSGHRPAGMWLFVTLLFLVCSAGHPSFSATIQPLTTPHFAIYPYPGTERLGHFIEEKAETELDYISGKTGLQPFPRITIEIMPRDENNAGRADPNLDWVAAWAIPQQRHIIVRTRHLATPRGKDVREILRHEICHILLGARNPGGDPLVCPRWFDEGVAMLMAKEWKIYDTAVFAKIIAMDAYRPLKTFSASFPRDEKSARVAYLESFSFVAYVNHTFGEKALKDIIGQIGPGRRFHDIFRQVTGRGLTDVENTWLKKLRLKFKWVPAVFGSFSIWTFITFLVFLGYARKKRKIKKIKARWQEDAENNDVTWTH